MTLRELIERRNNIITQSRATLDAAREADRELTAEERNNYDRMFAEQEALGARIADEERQVEAERSAAEAARRNPAANNTDNPSGPPVAETRTAEQALEQRRAERAGEFRSWIANTERNGQFEFRAVEARALQADSDVAGGVLYGAEQFVANLIQAVDDEVFIRRLATTYQVNNADSMGSPSLDADPADSDWTAEVLTGSEDSTMVFGKRSLSPHPLAKRIKVSKTLLRRAALGAEAIVQARLAYKFAITQEKAFLLGSGSNQPLGVFTPSNDGVPTTRDVLTGSPTNYTGDGLIAAKYALKGNYWKNAQWLVHRDGMKLIAQLKDTTNQYLWQPSIQVGQPDRLLSLPVNMSEYAPNTFTSGLYVGMLADFSNYWIADALSFDLQRLVELYAETNQVGFIGRMETDGMPVLAEAFVRLKTS